MTDHPITPPPELVQQWADMLASRSDEAVFSLAAEWGYEQRGEINEAKLQQARDQELEACIDFVRRGPWCSEKLRAARRPKPPSLEKEALKKEACNALDTYIYGNPDHNDKQNTYNTIRRALEALSND